MQSPFSARFHLEDAVYKVLNCDYLFYQDTDVAGNALTQVRSGELALVLEGSDNSDLLAWAANPLRKLSGEIFFFQGDQLFIVAEKLTFTDGSCVAYTEVFEPENPIGAYYYQLRIVANKLSLNDQAHTNDWPDYH